MFPFDLACYTYSRNNVLGFIIRIQRDLDLLAQIFKLIHENNANVISTFISVDKTGCTTIYAVLDVSKLETTLKDFLSLLRGFSAVVDIKVFEDFEGIAFNVERFPLMTSSERAIVLPQHLFEGLINSVRRRMGSGGDAVLYHVGYMSGCETSRYYIERFNLRDVFKLLKLLKLMMISLGWGVIEDYEVSTEEFMVRLKVRELWECSLYSGLRDPQSHFFRGFLAGSSSAIFNVEMKAKEIMCIGMGDDYCEFIVRRGS